MSEKELKEEFKKIMKEEGVPVEVISFYWKLALLDWHCNANGERLNHGKK